MSSLLVILEIPKLDPPSLGFINKGKFKLLIIRSSLSICPFFITKDLGVNIPNLLTSFLHLVLLKVNLASLDLEEVCLIFSLSRYS